MTWKQNCDAALSRAVHFLRSLQAVFARFWFGVLSLIQRVRYEWLFVAIAVPWGIAYIVALPPMQASDEDFHFYRAWGMAHGTIFCGQTLTVPVDTAAVSFVEKFVVNDVVRDGVYGWPLLQPYFSLMPSGQQREQYTQFCGYNPLSHAPQAIGIAIAETVNLPVAAMYYAGRTANFIICITLIFFAIRLTPFAKEAFVFAAILPKTIEQVTTVSGDGVHIAGLLLFTALVLALTAKEMLEKRDVFLLAILALLTVQLKPGYVGFLILLLAFSPQQLHGLKRYVGVLSAIIFAHIVLFLGLLVMVNEAGYQRPEKSDPRTQLETVINDPAGVAATFAYTVTHNIPDYVQNIFEDARQYAWIGVLFAGLILAVERTRMTWRQRGVFALAAIVTLTMIVLIEYIVWTPPGESAVRGLWGRYFIAIIPLAFVVFSGVVRLCSARVALLIDRDSVSRIIHCVSISGFAAIGILFATVTLGSLREDYYSNQQYVIPIEGAVINNDDLTTRVIKSSHREDSPEPTSIVVASDRKNSRAFVELSVEDLSGIAFTVESSAGVKIWYLREGKKKFDNDHADILSSVKDIALNVDMLEERYGVRIIAVRISSLRDKTPLTLRSLRVYK